MIIIVSGSINGYDGELECNANVIPQWTQKCDSAKDKMKLKGSEIGKQFTQTQILR